MKWRYRTRIEYVISALNTDVLREIYMADECIRRADSVAQPHSRFRREIALCAAAAMSNAAALAVEMLSMGGSPSMNGPKPRWRTHAASMEEFLFQAQSLLAHYQSVWQWLRGSDFCGCGTYFGTSSRARERTSYMRLSWPPQARGRGN